MHPCRSRERACNPKLPRFLSLAALPPGGHGRAGVREELVLMQEFRVEGQRAQRISESPGQFLSRSWCIEAPSYEAS